VVVYKAFPPNSSSVTIEAGVGEVQVFVGPGKILHVVVPNIRREDVIAMMSTFLSRGNPEIKIELDNLLAESPELTFTLQTGNIKEGTFENEKN